MKRILVCTDSECECKGSKKLLEELKTELTKIESNEYIISSFSCLGSCGLAPVVMVNNKIVGKASKGKIYEYINQNKHYVL